MPGTARVLIVGGSAAACEALVPGLRQAGLAPQCRQVSSDQALQEALAEPWDIVLAVDPLPGVAAETILQMARRMEQALPLIVVTDAAGDADAAALLGAGAVDVISPRTPSRLAAAVQRELRHAAERHAARQAVAQQQQTAIDLQERVKELTALRRASALLRRDEMSIPELLQAFAELLPPAWLEPQVTAARVQFAQWETQSAGFRDVPTRLSVPFQTTDGRQGRVEVVYLGTCGAGDDDPFLPEERRLIATLTEMLRSHFDRLQAQAAMQHSERRYRLLFDSTPHPMWVFDRHSLRFLDVNQTAIDHYGYTREQFLQMTLRDIRPPEDLAALEAAVRPLHPGAVFAGTARHLTRDGRTLQVEVTAHAVELDSAEACIVLAQDVTARLHAEEDSRRTASLLQAVAENTSDAVFVKDRQGRYLLCNHAAAAIMGRSPDEILGRDDEALFSSENAQIITASDRQVLRHEQAVTSEEQLSFDGETRTYLATKAPFRDGQGRVVGLVGISRDITDRRQLEQRYQHAQKMDAVGQLAGGVAHDFNNLLTIINGYCEVLLEQTSPDDPRWEALAEILRAGERSASLTRQLLAFSRRQMLALEVLDLNAIVKNTEKMLRRLIGEDIEFATRLAPGLLPVKADAGQLEQILLNLVVNARDAMPTGGRLVIETRNVKLDKAYARLRPDAQPGSHVMLSVSDTGCGMSPVVQSHIFEPFFTTKKVGEGTGLGLSVVHGIVNQLGGHVAVSSEVGDGSTFHILLPCQRESARRQRVAERADLPRGTETILLVEDEAGVRALANRTLQRCGYQVLSAADGADATARLQEAAGPINLLVTDVVMPRESGPQLAARLTEQFPGLRVLYVSGYTDDTIVRHGVQQHSVHFLQKPFSAAQLATKVRAVLDAPRHPAAAVAPSPTDEDRR